MRSPKRHRLKPVDDQTLFNWGFWDAYHTTEEPQRAEEPAYMAGFRCGIEQREAASFDTSAQRRAFAEFEKVKDV